MVGYIVANYPRHLSADWHRFRRVNPPNAKSKQLPQHCVIMPSCPIMRASATCFSVWALLQIYTAFASKDPIILSKLKSASIVTKLIPYVTLLIAFMMWTSGAHVFYYSNLTLFLLQSFNIVQKCALSTRLTRFLQFGEVFCGMLSIFLVFTITSYKEWAHSK
jgi:uncharacterized membrane protein